MSEDSSSILIVDDQKVNVLLLDKALQSLEANILHASSGPEALDIAQKNELALVFLDVHMPGMNGIEVAERLRDSEKTQHIPIIFVTAVADEGDYMFQGYEAGAVDFLYKPIDNAILRGKAQVFIELDQARQALAREVAERKQAEYEAQRSQYNYQVLVDMSPEPVIVSADYEMVYANPAAVRLLGAKSQDELMGVRLIDYIHPDDAEMASKVRASILDGQLNVGRVECRLIRKDHSIIDVEISAALIVHENRDAILLAVHNVTEQKAVEDELRRFSTMDGLTGLTNRRVFDELFQQEWHRAQRAKTSIGVIMFDLDSFKQYNDHFGHQPGDECLKAAAAALKESAHLRRSDVVARYGGEEFVVMLADTDQAGAEMVAFRSVEAVRGLGLEHPRNPAADVVTISAGVASKVPDEKHNPADLLRMADQSLYKAKEEGGNQVVSWNGEE